MLEQAAVQPSFYLHGKEKLKLKNEGVGEAKHALGLAYYEGSGVPRNIKTAFSWWVRAFNEDGNGASANNIGIMYEEGQSVSPDIENAIIHWKFAAFDGLVRAMKNLFRVYMNNRNHVDALNWYRLGVENGAVKDSKLEELISLNSRQLGKFDSKIFVQNLKTELRNGRFRKIILQREETINNINQLRESGQFKIFDQIAQCAPNTNPNFIIEHRKFFEEMRRMLENERRPRPGYVAVTSAYVHPANLKSNPNVDVIGLNQIHFKDMPEDVEKIYEGFAIKVVVIEDAIVGQPSVNIIGQDSDGNVKRIFIYNIPQNKETQDSVGYGCTITIVNPYHKIGKADGMPMIRVDNPSTVIYHSALTNKKRCRYCGDPRGTISCRNCKRAYYCSQKCLTLDSSENQHKLVCVKKL